MYGLKSGIKSWTSHPKSTGSFPLLDKHSEPIDTHFYGSGSFTDLDASTMTVDKILVTIL